jgi:hypothetical protein
LVFWSSYKYPLKILGPLKHTWKWNVQIIPEIRSFKFRRAVGTVGSLCDFYLYSKSSLTLKLDLSFPWVSVLFLNSRRVSSHIVGYDTSPPAIQGTQEKLSLNLHTLSVSVSKFLEYRRLCAFYLKCLIIISLHSHVRRVLPVWLCQTPQDYSCSKTWPIIIRDDPYWISRDNTSQQTCSKHVNNCNNAVILSSCYKVVTRNLLTNCWIAGR